MYKLLYMPGNYFSIEKKRTTCVQQQTCRLLKNTFLEGSIHYLSLMSVPFKHLSHRLIEGDIIIFLHLLPTIPLFFYIYALQSLYFYTSTPYNPFIFIHLLPTIPLFFYIYSLQSLYFSTSTPCNSFIFLHLLPAIPLFFYIYSLQSLYFSTSTPCNPFIILYLLLAIPLFFYI